MPVGFDDTIDVGLDGGALQRAARLGFDGCRKIGVLDLRVAISDFSAASRAASSNCPSASGLK
jgi:hypothetical protein